MIHNRGCTCPRSKPRKRYRYIVLRFRSKHDQKKFGHNPQDRCGIAWQNDVQRNFLTKKEADALAKDLQESFRRNKYKVYRVTRVA